jgi:3-phosphoshikimate 1-carboxyvinyltransferase
MQSIIIQKPDNQINAQIQLVASKSESNRALIIQALAKYQGNAGVVVNNLSLARDTQTMQRLLETQGETLDVIDAGTTMRFLTAYIAVTQQNKILTGTPRMCERPIKILGDALSNLGYKIEYLQNEGYPPLRIVPQTLQNPPQHILIQGDTSSQYISALLMVAPVLPQGLTLELTGKIASRPYIEMTLSQMAHFGIQYEWTDHIIKVLPQLYQPKTYTVESDWSGASYWFSVVSLAENAKIELLGLKADSLQGDNAIVEMMKNLGVKSIFTDNGMLLESQKEYAHHLDLDFSTCPDLAQTVVALCAVKGVSLKMTGLESLKIKETDRVAALQNEIKKLGADLIEDGNTWFLKTNPIQSNKAITIQTYDDHRMAMAFAPLALQYNLVIEHPNVVVKSYPQFWDDLKQTGFKISATE